MATRQVTGHDIRSEKPRYCPCTILARPNGESRTGQRAYDNGMPGKLTSCLGMEVRSAT